MLKSTMHSLQNIHAYIQSIMGVSPNLLGLINFYIGININSCQANLIYVYASSYTHLLPGTQTELI
jgi:hypothetical protein